MTALSNLALAAALMAGTATTHAALVARGGGMVYDTTLNVTWLADWNLAKSSGYDADGAMDWASAKSWADNLVYGGFDDWRLPSALSADGSGACGPAFDCTSELGHMFYANWGASSGQDYFQGSNTANLALFGNVQIASGPAPSTRPTPARPGSSMKSPPAASRPMSASSQSCMRWRCASATCPNRRRQPWR